MKMVSIFNKLSANQGQTWWPRHGHLLEWQELQDILRTKSNHSSFGDARQLTHKQLLLHHCKDWEELLDSDTLVLEDFQLKVDDVFFEIIGLLASQEGCIDNTSREEASSITT